MKRLIKSFPGRIGRVVVISASLLALLAGGMVLIEKGTTLAQMKHHGMGKHGMNRHYGAGGAGHDMANMPGLQGLDATAEESAELAKMFRNFPDISRQVSNLPNGIRTVTYSANEELMDVIISHVAGMINRVEEGRDPKVFIQSPTLDIIFERADKITTDIEVTEKGVVVVQTSTDPEVVQALHRHADEVSAMANRGMQAVHEAMMERHHN